MRFSFLGFEGENVGSMVLKNGFITFCGDCLFFVFIFALSANGFGGLGLRFRDSGCMGALGVLCRVCAHRDRA